MSKLIWDVAGQKTYETGVDHGVLYDINDQGQYVDGVAWNGLTAVTESPSGAENTDLYADNIKYLILKSAEQFGGTITAYTYPEEFEKHDGTANLADGITIGQQSRSPFGLCYRTNVGNDVKGNDYGYKIHLIYGASANPSEKNYQTINDSPEAIEFSWEFSTTPVNVTGFKPTASVIIDSTKLTTTAAQQHLADLEAILYGTDATVTYTEFTGNEFEQGVTYYERSGEEGHYVYTPTEDVTYDETKTYYTKSETAGTAPRLPLPDEVKSIFTTAG